MNGEQIWLWAAAGGAVALALLIACALLWRSSRQLSERLTALEAGLETGFESGLGARTATDATSTDPAATVERADTATYLITALDTQPEPTATAVPVTIDGKLFADLVARETVIKAAGLAHGVSRALSARSRNRIRFEMKREVKRSRRQRRVDLKAALRDLQARERAATADAPTAEDAA